MRNALTLTLSATLCTSLGPSALAQECATALDPETAAMGLALHRAGAYENAFDTGDLYIPLALHVVRRSDRSGGMPHAQLEAALDDLSGLFASTGIRLYVTGPIDYIDDDFFYTGMTSVGDVDILRSTNVVDRAVNVYFVDAFSTPAGGMCGISSFTTSPVQGIVIASSCAGVSHNRSTFAHELGHYFDLYHTHETMFGHECTSGVGCQDTGDLVCDTPADPTLGYHNVNGGCTFVGIQRDPCTNQQNYDPDVMNIMSSAPRMCRTRFSEGQIDRMRATIVNLRPELLEHCVADVDRSGHLGLFDVLTFQDMMLMGEPGADLNIDGWLTIYDLLAFQDAFITGCP